MQKAPISQLPHFLRRVVTNLAPGQVSPPIRKGKDTVFVKLVRRFPGRPRPFAEVSDDLRKTLTKQRHQEKLSELLGKLRKRSSIEVDEKVWQQLRQELLQETKNKE
jgi:parvulin-like peptidyl-prolyl isomerase